MATVRRGVLASVLFTVFGGPGLILGLGPYWVTGFVVPRDGPAWQRVLAGAIIAIGLIPLIESIIRFVRVGGVR
jgi:hypothetical protein